MCLKIASLLPGVGLVKASYNFTLKTLYNAAGRVVYGTNKFTQIHHLVKPMKFLKSLAKSPVSSLNISLQTVCKLIEILEVSTEL